MFMLQSDIWSLGCVFYDITGKKGGDGEMGVMFPPGPGHGREGKHVEMYMYMVPLFTVCWTVGLVCAYLSVSL